MSKTPKSDAAAFRVNAYLQAVPLRLSQELEIERAACHAAFVFEKDRNIIYERENARLREALRAVGDLCTTEHESKERFIARVLLCLPNA